MSLIDPDNPARWLDGEPRSQNNGFCRGLTDNPVNWHPLQHAENMRSKASKTVERQRAQGTDRSAIHGMSKKGDNHIRATKKATTVQTGPSKAQRLRDALASGPLTARELAGITGINVDLVPSLMQWDVSTGKVEQLRDSKPFRYALQRVTDNHREAA